MTKEILKQYRFYKKRISVLNRKIENLQREEDESVVKDTVQGSHKEFPYTMGHTTISGCPGLWETHSELRELREVRASYNCIVRDVERYVESIEDNIIRSAMSLKYIEGAHTPTWDKVAYQIGGGNTADGLRMAVTRFLSRE